MLQLCYIHYWLCYYCIAIGHRQLKAFKSIENCTFKLYNCRILYIPCGFNRLVELSRAFSAVVNAEVSLFLFSFDKVYLKFKSTIA